MVELNKPVWKLDCSQLLSANSAFAALRLVDVADPYSWKLVTKNGEEKDLADKV